MPEYEWIGSRLSRLLLGVNLSKSGTAESTLMTHSGSGPWAMRRRLLGSSNRHSRSRRSSSLALESISERELERQLLCLNHELRFENTKFAAHSRYFE